MKTAKKTAKKKPNAKIAKAAEISVQAFTDGVINVGAVMDGVTLSIAEKFFRMTVDRYAKKPTRVNWEAVLARAFAYCATARASLVRQ
jgi:hypothetical protein